MKKAIILSGPAGSGKTSIARAISEFYDFQMVRWTKPGIVNRRVINLKDIDLLIVEECNGLIGINEWNFVREKYPHCRFIFTTQRNVYAKYVDQSKFNLVNITDANKPINDNSGKNKD